MKKKDILSLIKYHYENEESRFRDVAQSIAYDFDNAGDTKLAEYIMGYISDVNTLSIQSLEGEPRFFTTLSPSFTLPNFPNAIQEDLDGINNALRRSTDVSKFLFYGPPGTGKTEYVRYLSHCLEREIIFVEFDAIINSKLGETTKNIRNLFEEIRAIRNPQNVLFLFDEIDALALDRVNANDLREMGRATSAFIKEMDRIGEEYLIVATTNMFNYLDDALKRRFDAAVDFGRYEREDLVRVSVTLMGSLFQKYNFVDRDMRLFKKILERAESLPYPGELKNLLKKCVVFSDGSDEYDYLKRLYKAISQKKEINPIELREEGFTLREIEKLTNISRSTISRMESVQNR